MKSALTRINPDVISIQSFASGAIDAVGIVVVIDVFRAFTVAAIALANGARQIIMVGDLDQALALRQQNLGRYCIGERGGTMPPGFDFGNSPAELLQLRFDGETLIQTTSNGTRGILAAKGARKIYAGSLVTADATVRAIANSSDSQVRLVPMGDKDVNRTDEDEICALYMRSRLEGRNPDLVAVRQAIETMSSRKDSGTLSQQDIDCCLQINSIPLAIKVEVKDGLFVATAE
jgi:2-phosphosulfolactate phosphatase